MTITPTDKGALIAGGSFWALLWTVVLKLDKIPFVNRFVSSKTIFSWVRMNKTLSLLISELVNLTMHPPSNPASTLFALGGTMTNAAVIFGIMPLADLFSRRRKVI